MSKRGHCEERCDVAIPERPKSVFVRHEIATRVLSLVEGAPFAGASR